MASRVTKSKSFDLKMSKKVAELTQVVHMLFMRNHEREVEVQLTKDLYNLELDRLHKKYQNQVGTSLTLSDKEQCDPGSVIVA